jgi:hypothetical protein
MSTIQNIRTNRITAQSITSNLYQGSNANITNINCNNETVNNLSVRRNIILDGNIDIAGDLGLTGDGTVYGNLTVWKYLSIGNRIDDSSQLHLCYDNGFETNPNFQLNAVDGNIAIQHYLAQTIIGKTNCMSISINNSNTSLGYQSLQQQPNDDNYNTAIGYNAGLTGENFTNCVFIGSNSGTTGLTGSIGSVCIGNSSGNYTTNNYNTFIGHQSGWTGSSVNYNGGTGNICIGAFSYPTTDTISNTVILGDVLNDMYITCDLTAPPSWSCPSDLRDKTDVENIPLGIDFINKIQPSRYKWDKRIWYENGLPDGSKKENKWTPGFIAQQLDQIQNENNAEYLNMIDKTNPSQLRISTGNLIPVIVKALQDLSKENEELKARITALENNS